MPKINLFAAPDGHRNAFEIFQEFIEEMEAQNCSGLTIGVNGKEYRFSITSDDDSKRKKIGYSTDYTNEK